MANQLDKVHKDRIRKRGYTPYELYNLIGLHLPQLLIWHLELMGKHTFLSYLNRRVMRTQTGLEFLNWAFSQINYMYRYVL